jgi:hypothetical protein
MFWNRPNNPIKHPVSNRLSTMIGKGGRCIKFFQQSSASKGAEGQQEVGMSNNLVALLTP